jgi:hypothetical protein
MTNSKTNFRDKVKGPILIIVSVLTIIWLSYRTHQQNLSLIDRFEKEGLFTIGKVVEYEPRTVGRSGGSSAFLKISYTINGLSYISECSGFIPETDGPKEGERYVAIYLPSEPRTCTLLLDYPVIDSLEFNKYMNAFKLNHPKLKR